MNALKFIGLIWVAAMFCKGQALWWRETCAAMSDLRKELKRK